MSSLKSRLKVLETRIMDNTPPEAIKVLMPKSFEEREAMREQYKDTPHVMLIVKCASKRCDTCQTPGSNGCRAEEVRHEH